MHAPTSRAANSWRTPPSRPRGSAHIRAPRSAADFACESLSNAISCVFQSPPLLSRRFMLEPIRASQDKKPPESSLVRRLSGLLDALQRCTLLHRILEHYGLSTWKEGEPRGHFDVIVDRYVLLFTGAALVIYPLTVYWKPFSERANFILAMVVVSLSALRLLDLISFHLNQLIARRGRPGGHLTNDLSCWRC